MKELIDALEQIELLSTNHGGWFERDPFAEYSKLGDIARSAIAAWNARTEGDVERVAKAIRHARSERKSPGFGYATSNEPPSDEDFANARAARAALSATHADGWQPIETAPKDGTRIILTDGRLVEAGAYAPNIHGDDFPWAFVDDYQGIDTINGSVGVEVNAFKAGHATHWRPLPATPSGEEG
jgi:hypothetical protein